MKPTIVPLSADYDRENFSCGTPQLDNYLKNLARQDMQRKVSVTFVALDKGGITIQGYYSTAAAGVSRDQLPKKVIKAFKLPKNASFGAHLLGRLAVDRKFQKQGLGAFLLIDALKRLHSISKQSAAFAVVVDPIDDAAVSFYERFGFIALPESKRMFLPMATLEQLFI